MTDWIDRMVFPNHWVDLRRSRDRLAHRSVLRAHRRELRREIGSGQVLRDRGWRIIGLGAPARDDALLRLDDGSLALVHLTWSGAPEPSQWPMTTVVTSLDELRAELEDRGWAWDADAPGGRDRRHAVIDGDEMWSLLRDLDDPDHLEWPADYDFVATRRQFDVLVTRIDAAFSCRSEADRHVEDASLHARLVVPDSATESGEPIVVSVSNFGGLATVSLTNPGAWSQAEQDRLLARGDTLRVHEALGALGYRVVPEEPLWSEYDGRSDLASLSPGHRVTWWTRFFDYL